MTSWTDFYFSVHFASPDYCFLWFGYGIFIGSFVFTSVVFISTLTPPLSFQAQYCHVLDYLPSFHAHNPPSSIYIQHHARPCMATSYLHPRPSSSPPLFLSFPVGAPSPTALYSVNFCIRVSSKTGAARVVSPPKQAPPFPSLFRHRFKSPRRHHVQRRLPRPRLQSRRLQPCLHSRLHAVTRPLQLDAFDAGGSSATRRCGAESG